MDDPVPQARFPSRRLTPLWLGVGGAAFLASLMVFLTVGLEGAVWSIPFLGAFLGGAAAVVLRPELLASRRLLVFGMFGTLFIASTLGLAEAFERYGERWWLAPANVGMQTVGLLMEVAMIGVLAVYPDGRYHRRFEGRIVLIALGVAAVLPIALLVTRPLVYPAWVFSWETESAAQLPPIASPLHLEPFSFLGGPLGILLDASLTLGPLTGVVVAVLRYRKLGSDQRAQVRWPSYGLLALTLAPVAYALGAAEVLSAGLTDAVAIMALTLLPVTVTIGLVRPHLFDIDAAMRRTLVYAPLWIAIVGAYIGIAAALGFAASGLGLVVAILVTIVTTTVLEPVRRRLTRGAAAWAYGEQLSGAAMVRLLGETVDDPRSPEQLAADIAEIARSGLGVRWARVSLRDRVDVVDGTAGAEPAYLVAALTHAGDTIGELSCGPREAGRSQPRDREHLETLASQASVVLHNSRLSAELRDRVEELAASRSRLVTAHETARRQIERDLHDGAQQDIVALIARIGLARAQLGDVSALEGLQDDARNALANLRQLAAGIHPTELVDHGLYEAVVGRTSRMPIETIVECPPETRVARFGSEVEDAAFFFVGEALANTLKHANANRVEVRLEACGERLEITVVDDGIGFDPARTSATGLSGLHDRLSAIGADLSVSSRPGAGTTVTALLPLGGPGV